MKKQLYILAGIALTIGACKSNTNKALPVLGNKQIVTKTVNGKTVTDSIAPTIPAFKFVNQ